jgi:hypothetical protein
VAQPATEPTPRAGTASAQGKNEGAAGKPARPTTGPETAQRTPTTAPAEARIDREQAVMHPGAAATEAPLEGDGIEAWVDLKGPARLQAQVGALLLELGQAPEALEHLQAADSLRGGHPGVGLLLGTAWYRLGDEYRCRLFLSSALEDERYRARAEEVLGRLSPPDAQGQVPGGEIATEDLEYFLGVLRRGSRLDYQDLSAPVVVTQTTSTGFGLGLTLGLALAGLGGLVGYVVSKRGEEEKRRKQILGASARAPIAPQKPLADVEGPREETQRPATARRPVDAPAPPEPRVRPAPAPVSMDDPEDNAVYQQVQAELERHLEKAAAAPLTPESLAGFDEPAAHEPFVVAPPAPAPAPQPVETDLLDEPDLNEQVYQMADANRPIVEIAEALELGEDEVKLILDLRPQLPED